MANTNKFAVKNGLQTQNIDFVSPDGANTITLSISNTDILSISGNAGQLFSITDSFTGTIFSANDGSGVPSIEVLDTGLVKLAQYSGNVLIGTGTDGNTGKLQVNGVAYSLGLDVNGSQVGNIVAVSALDIDCSDGNYFTKTISADSTFTFSNSPASRAYGFTLELTHTSGTVTWPSAVKWPGDTAPSLTTGKTHLFVFVTDDGGTRWRGSSLTNYTN